MKNEIERDINCFIEFVIVFRNSMVDTNPTVLEQKVDFCTFYP